MPSKEEKDRRKQLASGVKKAEQAREEASRPLDREVLSELFNYVDAKIEAEECDHSLRFTREFLSKRGADTPVVIEWLQSYGGFCDCEVAANVEERWGEE